MQLYKVNREQQQDKDSAGRSLGSISFGMAAVGPLGSGCALFSELGTL